MPRGSRSITLNRSEYEQLKRVHVTRLLDWGSSAGTDFWLMGSNTGVEGLATTQASLFSENGWTTTSLAATLGSAADFGSAADQGIPPSFLTDASADQLRSPAIFGDYRHMHQAMIIMGYKALPRYLIADVHALYSVHSADEATTGLGFVEDGGSAVVSADKMGAISTNGTNWTFNINATVTVSTIADDALPHNFRIVLDRTTGLGYGYVDGVVIDAAGTAITADEFPVSFGVASGVTNRIQLSGAHVFYAWRVPMYV